MIFPGRHIRTLAAILFLAGSVHAHGISFATNKAGVNNELEEFDFANGLFARGMYDLAVDGYKEFLERYPNSRYAELAAYRIGESYFLAQKYNEALNRFSIFLSTYPSSELSQQVVLRRGQIYYLQDKYDEAEKILTPLVQEGRVGTSPAAKYYLAGIFFKKKDLEKSKNILDGIVSVPGDSEYISYAHLNLGDIYFEKKEYLKAAGEYSKASAAAKDTGTARQADLRAGNSYAKVQDHIKAAEAYSRVTDPGPQGSEFFDAAAVGLVSSFYKSGKHDQAVVSAENLLPKLSQDEARAQIMYLKGSACLSRGDMEGAEKAYAEVYAKYPDTDAGRKSGLNECWALLELKRYDECLGNLESYMQKTTSSREEALFLKAKALDGAGRSEEAAAVYASVAADFKDTSFGKETMYEIGWLYSRAKNGPKAVESFRKFVEAYPADPRSPRVLLRSGQENLSIKLYKEAERDYMRFLALFKDDPQRENAAYQLGMVYVGMEAYDRAIQAFEDLIKGFPASKARDAAAYMIGRCYQGKQEWDKAIGEYSTIASKPAGEFYPQAVESAGYCYFQKGDHDKAAEWYSVLIAKRNDYKLPDSVYKWLADHYLKIGDMEKSLAALKGYMGTYPQAANGAELLYLFGENHRLLGENDKAEEYFRKVIDAGTESSVLERSYLGLGIICSQRGDFEKALEYLTRAAQGHKDNITGALARMEIANLRFKIMDYDTAAKDYMMVAILYDDKDLCPKALERAAFAFEKANKKDKAIETIKELIERYPESESSGKAREELRRLESAKN